MEGNMPLGPKRLNCYGSLEMAKLQLLGSLSTCLLTYLDEGPDALKVRTGRGGKEEKTSTVDTPNHAEVQMGFDDRGLYAASNAGAIDQQTYMGMLTTISNLKLSSDIERSDSTLQRAIVRIRQLQEIMPTTNNPKYERLYENALESSSWFNLVHIHVDATSRDAKSIFTFLTMLLTGKGLDAAVSHENKTTWPQVPDLQYGGVCLHAELRILYAAWQIGNGDLYINGAKRACWGCSNVFNALHTHAALPVPVQATVPPDQSAQASSSQPTPLPFHALPKFRIHRLLDDQNEVVGGVYSGCYCGLHDLGAPAVPTQATTLGGPARRKSITFSK
ncbi:hypothetical protein [Rugamonas rivuli]|uniref:Uncharacterized protein n=1 Tax=Rugamonas rivuli TaxID=2743358 RepID=A0A843SKN8_9BURK|nr:hypothetical protein [Rugamonas rivuli]MQA23018.1 hypothetical protein [Rugamonas rivuli]